MHNWIKYVYDVSAEYILAAITMTSVFAVRLTVLALSAPAFVLLALVGIIDGLVRICLDFRSYTRSSTWAWSTS
ncbi:DUF4400 domain-containing protein [Crenothrix sp.]|uniref:DUF4400 domain-containing protein n=1 Tax=Crenothrix sp. TaxID=3100433 RepID=UPI00374D5726